MDGIKAATLAPCDDEEVLGEIGRLCRELHLSLDGAKILVFWALDKPAKWWGAIKIATEQLWWATGGCDGGADILLTLNQELWGELGREARTGLLDHFLDQVRAKESGNSKMATQDGIRQLYERSENTLKLSDRVMARNPAFVQAITELKRLWRALADPAQFQLELEAVDEQGEADDDLDDEPTVATAPRAKRARKKLAEIVAAPLAKAPTVRYYKTADMPDLGPCALRYEGADLQPVDLDGVYYFTDGEQPPADLAALSYREDLATLRTVRMALEETHKGWASAALAKAQPAAA